MRYNTMGDSRVRHTHARMDGQVYRADDAVWDVWTPPNGYRCRCYVTAHSEAEAAQKGWELAQDLPWDTLGGRPLLPDDGFQRNPAKVPTDFNWSRFPPAWRTALGVT